MPQAAYNNAELSQPEKPTVSSGASDLELFEQYLDTETDFDLPDRGDVQEGIIVEIRPDELLVNVGRKRNGVVPQSELAKLDPDFIALLQEGQTINVVVRQQAKTDDGLFQLSIVDAPQKRTTEKTVYIPLHSISISLTDSNYDLLGFSVDYLIGTVMRYLNALISIQHIIDDALMRPSSHITILGIHYGSVKVDITGGIRETVELILDVIVPWRHRTARERAELGVREKEIELKQKEIETQRARAALKQAKAQVEVEQAKSGAEAERIRAEAQKIAAEARLLQTQAEEQALSNQKIRLEIVKLALEMVDKKVPNLSEEQRLLMAMQMVGPVQQVATSPLELVSWRDIGGPKATDDNAQSSANEDEKTTTDQ